MIIIVLDSQSDIERV